MLVDLKKEDPIISDFLRSLGPWKDYVVVGGGYALIIYKLYLDNPNQGNPPVGTRDLDSLIPRKLSEVSKKNIGEHLKEAGFVPFFKDYGNPATEAYVKEINGSEVEIEFLTDDSSRLHKEKNIMVSGVIAQPLTYLKMSLENTIPFKTFSGHQGKVVSPSAWIFHKGLTFPKRANKSKVFKDLYGIWYAGSQLDNLSTGAITEIKLKAKQHPKWYQTFRENLHEWIEEATPADWIKLEAQDPYGELKKPGFVSLISLL